MKVFRIKQIEISEANLDNPNVLKAQIEQRYNILFGLFHYWSSPSFAPPHLFRNEEEAYRYIKRKYPNAVVYDNYTGNVCKKTKIIMAKIPFTLDAWLKDRSQKVETRDGRPALYIGLDRAGWQVFEIFRTNGTIEYATYHDSYLYSGPGESPYDLFIVTPEPELSEFEKGLVKFYRTRGEIQPDKDGVFNRHEVDELLHKAASELLSLAREQFIKDGYVIEKKIFHDAVEKVDPGIMKEVSKNVDMQIALRTEYEKGRADALKDLPRRKKVGRGNNYSSETKFTINGRYLEMNDTLNDVYEVSLSKLEKLPKED